MKRRPWPLVLLAVSQFLAPITNVILSASLQQLSVFQYLQLFFRTKTWWETSLFFGLFPIAGYAIWSMRKWSYPVFLAVVCWTFIRNYQTYYYYPNVFSVWFLAGAYAVNIGLVSYFLIPAVRAVYFNPKLRWWEAKPRYELKLFGDLQGSFGAAKCQILNISEGGVFVETSQSISKGDEFQLSFSFYALNVVAKSQVVFQSPTNPRGFGLMFMEPDQFAQDHLSRMVRALRLLGVEERSGQDVWWEDLLTWARTALTTGKGLVPQVPKHPIRPNDTTK